MKNTLLLIGLILTYLNSSAQTFEMVHDHSTIQVKNIKKSVEFYRDILQLKEIKSPWPDNEYIRFFETGNNQELHIGQVTGFGEIKVNKVLHLAFAVKEFDKYVAFLKDKGVAYSNFAGENEKIQLRPDGVRQIYFQDPDGYWVEINDAEH